MGKRKKKKPAKKKKEKSFNKKILPGPTFPHQFFEGSEV